MLLEEFRPEVRLCRGGVNQRPTSKKSRTSTGDLANHGSHIADNTP